MNARQKRFCDEYLIDCNAKQAAVRAGYSPKTAYAIGAKNLKKPELKAYLEEQLQQIHDEKIADVKEVMEYLTSVMRREKMENIVVTIMQERSEYIKGEDGKLRKQTVKEESPEIVKIPPKLSDANKAAELIGKRYGLFKDGLTVDIEPVVIVNDLKE